MCIRDRVYSNFVTFFHFFTSTFHLTKVENNSFSAKYQKNVIMESHNEKLLFKIIYYNKLQYFSIRNFRVSKIRMSTL